MKGAFAGINPRRKRLDFACLPSTREVKRPDNKYTMRVGVSACEGIQQP
jgi:hypothetical protein